VIIIDSGDVDIEAYKQSQSQQRVVSIPVRSVNDVMLKLKQTIKTSHRSSALKDNLVCFRLPSSSKDCI
jgi:hypothetical protein